MAAIVVRSQRVVLPDRIRPAAVYISDGRITAIRDYAHIRDELPIIEAGQHVVMPGLVDTHVHINEPGRTDWEGFATATRAAAAGGVTTVVDMPLNSVPATTALRMLCRSLYSSNSRRLNGAANRKSTSAGVK